MSILKEVSALVKKVNKSSEATEMIALGLMDAVFNGSMYQCTI